MYGIVAGVSHAVGPPFSPHISLSRNCWPIGTQPWFKWSTPREVGRRGKYIPVACRYSESRNVALAAGKGTESIPSETMSRHSKNVTFGWNQPRVALMGPVPLGHFCVTRPGLLRLWLVDDLRIFLVQKLSPQPDFESRDNRLLAPKRVSKDQKQSAE